jgi:hypothetical protein
MDEGFSAYLESKQAGPLSCPICGQTNTFEPKGSLAATRAYPSLYPQPHNSTTPHAPIADTLFSLTHRQPAS